ncbi:hypothetical protein [Haloferax larsenii]|uniref:Uncharacterized protein n=1 Tax=Haloferax larsenii TaxID=302484 RepID=A0A1H7RJ65_HALLR|nr:hypothetical protein [Haloferax larsenii]SEL60296.1 hypothetical protein SAMN04488691_10660 [Haloferax larsenii]
MLLLPAILLGSLLGTGGLLVAYDPTPLCDFRDFARGPEPLDQHGLFLWRCGGVAVAAVGLCLSTLALLA